MNVTSKLNCDVTFQPSATIQQFTLDIEARDRSWGPRILYYNDRTRPYKEQEAAVQQSVACNLILGGRALCLRPNPGWMLSVERERLLTVTLKQYVSRHPLLSVIEIPLCRSAAWRTERTAQGYTSRFI